MRKYKEVTMSDAEWRIIPGYDRYEVNEYGEVRNVSGRALHPFISKKGYRRFRLKVYRYLPSAHGLVALAFIGPRPEGMQINHKDGDKLNNH